MANALPEDNQDFAEYLEGEELDRVREVLVYILMKDTLMGAEEIYSLVFNEGDAIHWQ